jgi:hypothetical protein
MIGTGALQDANVGLEFVSLKRVDEGAFFSKVKILEAVLLVDVDVC